MRNFVPKKSEEGTLNSETKQDTKVYSLCSSVTTTNQRVQRLAHDNWCLNPESTLPTTIINSIPIINIGNLRYNYTKLLS